MMKRTLRFTEAVQAAMKQQGIVSVRDLADRCDANYEMVRRVVTGDILPSKHLFTEISNALAFDMKEAEKLWLQDKIETDYKRAGAVLPGRNPEMQPIEAVWPHLSEQHRRDLISIAKTFAENDRGIKQKVS